MYRQPENSNRVKSMKSRFEGLNDSNKTEKINEKARKSPVQHKISSKPPVFSSHAKLIGKTTQKIENNNNDYNKIYSNKNGTKENNENINLDFNNKAMKPEDTSRNKIKFDKKTNVEKDFSDINKKELCNVPPLNLTRQLNDPTKKGCIKRTPAFRKDKLLNSKVKANDDLNFASIVNMFENNDKSTCDTVNTNIVAKHLTRTCCSDSEIKSEITKISYTPKKSLTSTVSLDGQTSKISNSETKYNKNLILKSKLTASTSLGIENKNFKTDKSQIRQKSLSPILSKTKINNHVETFNTSSIATLKISDKENMQLQTRELLDNLTNNHHENDTKALENKEIISIPAYAQVNKPKKSTEEKKDLILTDTLKAALKQPLPSGPPPKKPPRTFAHTPNSKLSPQTGIKSDHNTASTSTNFADVSFCEKLNENLAHGLKIKTPESSKKSEKMTKIKSDPKLMLQKLENALLHNKIKSPKLPRKLKSSLDASSSSSHQGTSQPNIYTTETPQKNLFPNCLPSLNCVSTASATNSYSKVISAKNNASTSTFFTECKGHKQEPIYAEPFQFHLKEETILLSSSPDKPDTLSSSLHYMSNPVCEWKSANQSDSRVPTDNTNGGETSNNKCDKSVSFSENGPLTRHKLNLIMNHTYATPSPTDSDIDSLPSTPSSEETPNSKRNTIKDLILNFEQKHQLEPNSFNIPSTVKQRLNKPTDTTDEDKNTEEIVEDKKKFKAQLSRTLTEIRKTYVKRVCSTIRRKNEIKTEINKLFECCLLVGLNVVTLTPYIKNKFPSQYDVPPWVEHLCFPDATEWSSKLSKPNINSQDCQCYSLVITNEKGDRKFGYCRRVVPEETSVCLPLTYCIISSFKATGFYHKVLQELESRHGLPFGLQEAFVKELYNCKFPQPGESVKVPCLLRSVVVDSCKEMIENNQITSPENVECVKRIVNMQNGVYGHINRCSNDSLSENTDWILLEPNKSDDKTDFKSPKITYGSAETSFSKIQKYSQDLKRSNSSNVNNTSETLDALNNSEVIRRLKPDNSFASRHSEPQINKRVGHLFEKLNVNDSSEVQTNSPVKINNSTSDNSQYPLLNLPNSQLLHDCLIGDIVLKRPYDTRLEDVDLTMLFNTLDLTTLLQTFGSLLHERKVIFVSSCLSKLSSCVEALQSILYPFSWQHTFIPVLSNNMLDIVSAPLPLIAGVLSAHITETLIIEDGIAVNLDTSTLVCYMGDESEIIPKRLQKGLTIALQLVTQATQSDDRTRNVLVSEAFIRMFVEACGCYKQFIIANDNGQKYFERESFIKHHQAKCVNLFLEWFSETAMFNCFIQSRLEGEAPESMFEQRCVELNCEKNSAALLKNSKVTQKMKHFGQRLFH